MTRVVITGVGVVAPNAGDFASYAAALQEGRSGIGELQRFDVSSFSCRLAGEIVAPVRESLLARFPALERIADAKVFFGLKAFLELYESYPFPLAECAVNLGTSLESFRLDKLFQLAPFDFGLEAYLRKRSAVDALPYLQVPLDFLGTFIKREFGIEGANFLNCGACTAGTEAIGHGLRLIRSGRYQRVLCGGFDSMLNPLGLGGFSALGALSDEHERGPEAIRPFDVSRKGTLLGEGAALFVLEELDAARQRGATILAEVGGYGASLDAHKVSTPWAPGLALAMSGALADAGVEAAAIDYISAHGTGTPLNDRCETEAIRQVFGAAADQLAVSSQKSMIGHLIGASGAVEVAGVLAMLKHDFIAPTINLGQADPDCDLDYVAKRARSARLNLVLKNSMGFGGQNACLVLRRYVPDIH